MGRVGGKSHHGLCARFGIQGASVFPNIQPMSAICGIFNLDAGPVDENILLRMRDIVDYRGPDGAGIWTKDGVGLGHRLLVTTEESVGEKQPLTDGNGLWIVADCRIDNRDELKDVSVARGKKLDFDSLPDVAYILHAYAIWGEDVGNHLLGDFSFAIWDGRRRNLFGCRDIIGMKPFMYYWNGRRLLFGSEMKQLFEAEVPKSLNLAYLGGMIFDTYTDHEETPYEFVRKLPPGHSLTLHEGVLNVKRYWNWDPDEEPLSRLSLRENGEQFHKIFTQAVEVRLRHPEGYRNGSLLSGGLDSSSIVSVAASRTGFRAESLPVFALRFPEIAPPDHLRHYEGVDESRYRDAVIERFGLRFLPVDIKGWGPFENYRENVWHQDHPLTFSNLAYFQHLFQTVRESGVRSLLSGEGGDDIFIVGSQCFVDLLRRGDLLGFFNELRGRHRILGTSYFALLNSAFRMLLPEVIKVSYRRFIKRPVPSWLREGFVKEVGLKERSERDLNWQCQYNRSRSFGIFCHIHSAASPLGFEVFERMASSCQLEARYPFFDLRLLRFMASVPWRQKTKEGVKKCLLREALKDTLPPLVRDRLTKSEFTSVVRRGFERYTTAEIKGVFDNPHPILSRMVHMSKVRRNYESCLRPRRNTTLQSLSFMWPLWYLVNLDRWLKEVHDENGKTSGLVTEKGYN